MCICTRAQRARFVHRSVHGGCVEVARGAHLGVLLGTAQQHEARVAEARGVHARVGAVDHGEAKGAAPIDALCLHLALADLRDSQHVRVARLRHVLRGVHEGARKHARVDAVLPPHVDPIRYAQAKRVERAGRVEVGVLARVAVVAVVDAANSVLDLFGVRDRDPRAPRRDGRRQGGRVIGRHRLDARQQVALELRCTRTHTL